MGRPNWCRVLDSTEYSGRAVGEGIRQVRPETCHINGPVQHDGLFRDMGDVD